MNVACESFTHNLSVTCESSTLNLGVACECAHQLGHERPFIHSHVGNRQTIIIEFNFFLLKNLTQIISLIVNCTVKVFFQNIFCSTLQLYLLGRSFS